MESPQLCRGAKLTPIEVHQAEATTAGQELLVPLGKRNVARPVRNDQDLEQGQTRRDCRQAPIVDLRKDPIEQWQKARMLLDEVDERDRIERERAISDLLNQSHDLRS